MIATSDPAGADARPPRSRPVLRVLLVVVLALLAAMWIYAFLFAPKEGVNRIGDREWSDRAELRCSAAKDQLVALADMRTIDDVGEGALTEKAAIVDKTNIILTDMLDDLAAVEPTDEKGQEIIPLWLDDYRAYVADRRTYADRLRAGENPPFAESAVEGSPITGFINDVARQNNMPSCQAPVDLSA